ncbi:hypothetical protein HGI47_04060 [Novosphingobium sp. ERN07]|nr:hypothetical protein [Novosphingobium sp. ERN07]
MAFFAVNALTCAVYWCCLPGFAVPQLRWAANLVTCMVMAADALNAALDRLEQALSRVEGAVSQQGNRSGETAEELALLRVRHRKLKDTVAQELRQLDLLLAGLPK